MDRGFNEYEAALYRAIADLAKTLLESGMAETALLRRLKEDQAEMTANGSISGAATLGFLIEELIAPPTYYVPKQPPSN